MTNDTVHFNVYCTTIKQQQSTRYSKTVLYNDNNTINTSITGLLPNTTYTCCVLAVTSYGESEPVCQNITTTNITSECIECDSKTVLYNDNNTVNTSITGLLPNTTYTCCVLAVTTYGESEPVCQNITTTNVTSE